MKNINENYKDKMRIKGVIVLFVIFCVGLIFGQESWNIELHKNYYGGAPSIAIMNGNLLFTNFGTKFTILDYSDRENPIETGYCYLPGNAEKIILKENFAFIHLGNNSLVVVDISEPENPDIQDTPELSSGYYNDFDISGDLLMCVGYGDLKMYDISEYPFECVRETFIHRIRNVLVQGNLFFVSTGSLLYMFYLYPDYSFDLLDIIDGGGKMINKGNTIFAGGEIFDFSSMDSLVLVDRFTMERNSIDIFDESIYIKTPSTYYYLRTKILKIDISDIYDISITDSFFLRSNYDVLLPYGDNLFLKNSSDEICLFDLNDSLLSTRDSVGAEPLSSYSSNMFLEELAVIDNYIYSIKHNALAIYDISDLNEIAFVDSITPINANRSFKIIDSTLIFYSNYILSYDISNPLSPRASHDPYFGHREIISIERDEFSGLNTAFESDYWRGFIIFKFDTLNFYEYGSIHSLEEITPSIRRPEYAVSYNNYAYLFAEAHTSGVFYLMTFDISDSTDFEYIGYSIFTHKCPLKVERKDNYLFISSSDSSFTVFDLSTSETPVEISRIVFDNIIEDFCITDSFAYLACGSNGLVILGINNPESLTISGYYRTMFDASNLAIYGNYAIVNSYSTGFCILDISEAIESISEPPLPNTPENISLAAYPNPFNSAVSIELPKDARDIEIYDINGKLCHKSNVHSQTYSWHPAQELESGIYCVKVISRKNEFSSRVVYIK